LVQSISGRSEHFEAGTILEIAYAGCAGNDSGCPAGFAGCGLKREIHMILILIILLVLLLGGGGGYYGHSRWGYRGGAGVGLGTILLVLLIIYIVGGFR